MCPSSFASLGQNDCHHNSRRSTGSHVFGSFGPFGQDSISAAIPVEKRKPVHLETSYNIVNYASVAPGMPPEVVPFSRCFSEA